MSTSRIILPGTSYEIQTTTSPGRNFRASPRRQIGTSPGCQIETSPGRSNRVFRGRPGDNGGGHPWDVLGTNICQLGIDNENKDILIFCEGPRQVLYDTALIAKAKYSTNFIQPRKRFVLSLCYSNCSLFVNAAKLYQFKAKDSEMKDYALCLDNTSKDLTINNMKKQD